VGKDLIQVRRVGFENSTEAFVYFDETQIVGRFLVWWV